MKNNEGHEDPGNPDPGNTDSGNPTGDHAGKRPPAKVDPGLRLVARAYRNLPGDDANYTLPLPGGFARWAWRHRQLVQARPAGLLGGVFHFKVDVAADFVKDVRGSDQAVHNAIEAFIPQLSGNSFLQYDSRARTVRLCAAFHAAEGDGSWIADDIGAVADLQLMDAERLSEEFAAIVEGVPHRSRHPVAGERTAPDGKFRARCLAYESPCGNPNRWFDPETVLGMILHLKAAGIALSGKDRCLEAAVPFGDGCAATLRMARTVHETLGEGCMLSLELPVTDSPRCVQRMADILNRQETGGQPSFHSVGSWKCVRLSPGDSARLEYATFLPAALFAPGKLEQYVDQAIARSEWAALNRERLKADVHRFPGNGFRMVIPGLKQR